jgi:uncharacterized protein (TIGR02271 family)
MITMERLETMKGSTVYDSNGEKIGSVEEVYVHYQTSEPEWIGLGTGLLGTKRVVVPAATADAQADGIAVPYSKDQVKDAPDIDGDSISQEAESALYAHYGLEYSDRRSDTGLPEGTGSARTKGKASGGEASGEASVTRSEEELRVGKREVEAGHLRLHKWVETEQVDVPVEIKREKARVTREPVEGAATGEDIGEESLEVTLTEEKPVVQKETVAKERIGVEKEVERDTETVSEEVRKERVEVDDERKRR